MITSVRNPKVAAALKLHKRAFRERERAFLVEGPRRSARRSRPRAASRRCSTRSLAPARRTRARRRRGDGPRQRRRDGAPHRHGDPAGVRRRGAVRRRPARRPVRSPGLRGAPARGPRPGQRRDRAPLGRRRRRRRGRVLLVLGRRVQREDRAGLGGLAVPPAGRPRARHRRRRSTRCGRGGCASSRWTPTARATSTSRTCPIPSRSCSATRRGVCPKEIAALADATVRVPITGRAESLNLAAAATVCLFEWERQRREGRRAVLETIIAAAAHDIRSPLTAMKGFGHALATRWEQMTPEDRDADAAGDPVRHRSAERDPASARGRRPGRRRRARAVPAANDRRSGGRGDRDLAGPRSRSRPRRVGGRRRADGLRRPRTPPAGARGVRRIAGLVGERGTGARRGHVRDGRLSVQARRAGTELTQDDAERLFRPRAPGTGSGSKIGLFVALGVAEAQGGRVSAARRGRRAQLPARPPGPAPSPTPARLERVKGPKRPLLDSPHHGPDRGRAHPRAGARARARADRRGADGRGARRGEDRGAGAQGADSRASRARSGPCPPTRARTSAGGPTRRSRDLRSALEARRDELEEGAEDELLRRRRASTSPCRAGARAGLAAPAHPRRRTGSSRSSRGWGTGWPRAPRSRTSGTTSRRSTSRPIIPRGR